LGIASGFDVWHLGMTHNGSGAHMGCLGYELSVVGAGVDLAAAATDRVGGTLGQTAAAADLAGYQRLLGFGQAQVPGRRCWAVEGAGSYGAGLTSFLQAHGELVVEIGRPKRLARRTGAKSDALDALRAAREALACDHLVTPRRRGDREALRVLLATRHSACRAKVGATNQLKALIVRPGRAASADRSGDRQLNRALHTIVVGTAARRFANPRLRRPAPSRGKSARDVRRCLKRVVARQLFKLLERYDRAAVELANLS
jgi:hypothetical protein